jgi:hypothetical protein
MNFPTLYITGFDDTTTRDEILEVLSISCPGLARWVLATSPLAMSSQISLPTYTDHSLCVNVTFRDSLAFVGFLPSTPPQLTAKVIGAVLALNGSKVVPRRCISSTNSWSPYGLRVVLDPSHLGALSQHSSLKDLADAYPAVYGHYLPPDFAVNFDMKYGFTDPRSALSRQFTVVAPNRAVFTTNLPLPPTPETPSTALESPLSADRPEQSRLPGHIFPPLSVPLLSVEYEDQGMVSLPTKNSFSTDDSAAYQEEISLAFQASRGPKVADPEVSLRQTALDDLEAQPSDPAAVLKEVTNLRRRRDTTREELKVTEAELERQNTEYTSVLGQLSEERKEHKFTKGKLEEMRGEAFARTCEKCKDAEQRTRRAEQLAKDAQKELDAFKNDDRDATRLLRDAKFHERQCVKAGKRREQAEAELKKVNATYKLLCQEHETVKAVLARAKGADQGGEDIRHASNSLALENLGLPSSGRCLQVSTESTSLTHRHLSPSDPSAGHSPS